MECTYLFSGILFHEDLEEAISQKLAAAFGTIVLESKTIPFDFSTYYDEEMGKALLRKWVLFDAEIEQGSIVKLKKQAMSIEQELSHAGNRMANIDPGYLTLSKVVLPTTKDCSHRIYLGDGIYAETTLMYFKGAWRPQDWTYRDYCTKTALEFFSGAREFILKKRKR